MKSKVGPRPPPGKWSKSPQIWLDPPPDKKSWIRACPAIDLMKQTV
jgi:hypothetical protein